MDTKESLTKYQKAKLRVDKVKGFYSHLGVFTVVNLMIIGFKVSDNLDSWSSFSNELFSLDALSTFIVWGAILIVHAFSVFVFPSFMGYEWEQRKIQEFMDDELKTRQ